MDHEFFNSVTEELQPRTYQVDLLNKALKSNSIVFLGTGMGKTFIAVQMIREMKFDLQRNHKKVVFVVHTNALGEQQKDYLARHTGLMCIGINGFETPDSWTSDRWSQVLKDHQILVFTGSCLLRALNGNNLSLTSVGLLVVDECHQAIGDSSVAQVFRTHFTPLVASDPASAPRVLGLTASIVTSKVSIETLKVKVDELASTLHSRVITTDAENLEEAFRLASVSSIKIVEYPVDPVNKDLERVFTNIAKSLDSVFANEVARLLGENLPIVELASLKQERESKLKKIQKFFRQAQSSIREIGISCGRRVVEEVLSLLSQETLIVGGSFFTELEQASSAGLESIKTLLPSTESSDLDHEKLLSSKVLRLLEIVRDNALAMGSDLRMIVFVEERAVAVVLADILSAADIPGVRVASVVGMASGQYLLSDRLAEMTRATRKQQLASIRNFRIGVVNVVVATSVLEEGIDVPSCNVVLRFGEVKTYKSFVQSRGRARARDSRLIVLAPEGDGPRVERELNEYLAIERMSVEFCHGGSADADASSSADVLEPLFADDRIKTGPRLTRSEALHTVAKFVQRFQPSLAPLYDVQKVQSPVPGFVALLHLPRSTGYLVPFRGSVQLKKNLAKCDAALKACRQFRDDGLLDDRLALRQRPRALDLVAVDISPDKPEVGGPKAGSKQRRRYCVVELPPQLAPVDFCTRKSFLYRIDSEVVQVSRVFASSRISARLQDCDRKLAVIVGQRFSSPVHQSPVQVKITSGTYQVRLQYISTLRLSSADFNSIIKFQTSVIPAVLNCPVGWTRVVPEAAEFLIAVVDESSEIDFELMAKASEEPTSWDYLLEPSRYSDAVVEWSGDQDVGRRFFVDQVLTEVSNELDDDESFHGSLLVDERWPKLVTVSAELEQVTKRRLLSPKDVRVCRVPASLWVQLQVLPGFLDQLFRNLKLDNFSRSLEATLPVVEEQPTQQVNSVSFLRLIQENVVPNSMPTLDELAKATTLREAQEPFNLESLEFLGDAILKFVVSLALFVNRSLNKFDEGFLVEYRKVMVNNKVLFRLADSKKLQHVLKVRKFFPTRHWMPPGLKHIKDLETVLSTWEEDFCQEYAYENWGRLPQLSLFDILTPDDVKILAGCELDERDKFELLVEAKRRNKCGFQPAEPCLLRQNVSISDKSLADAVEALVAVFFLRFGIEGAVQFLEFLGLRLNPNEPIQDLIRALNEPVPAKSSVRQAAVWFRDARLLPRNVIVASQQDVEFELAKMTNRLDIEKIESVIGYRFKEKSFVIEAFTHSSYLPNQLTRSYERLEFLGDAILGFLVTTYIYFERDGLELVDLFEITKKFINNESLVSAAIRLGLQNHLLHQSPNFFRQIGDFLKSREENDEAESAKSLPKVLADVVEALIGAVYLDSKGDLGATWSVVTKMLPSLLESP